MSYRVELAATGQSFEVAAGESVLAAGLRAGINLAHDCQAGGCGTCRVRLIGGNVDYAEFPLALTPEEAEAGYALACQATPCSDLVIDTPPPFEAAAPERHAAVIHDIRPLGRFVTHLTLDLPEAAALTYLPGQYMNILLPDGSARSFSMASAPRGGLLDFHIRRIDGGAFTGERLAALRAGDRLDVELPHGGFRLHAEDYRPLLMVATGTGIAPIKAMLESLLDDDDCPPVSLYWGMQTPADLYLDDEIRTWADRLYEFNYVPVLSRADADWDGRRGHVQDAVIADLGDLSEHAVYLCGSPNMIADAKRAFLAAGAPLDFIYTEGFAFQPREPALT